MALTAQQITYLKSASQRFRARLGVFSAPALTITPPSAGANGTLLEPLPIPRCTPRYAVVGWNDTVDLYIGDSYNRGGGAATASAALAGGSAGSLMDNGGGSYTYTAPASGIGTDVVEITATNANGSLTAYAYMQFSTAADVWDEVASEVVSISAGVDQHGYKWLLRCHSDVQDFAIGKLVHLHVEDTWDGTQTSFGGYIHHETTANGYITAMQQFEDASGETWLGLEVQSPWYLMSKIPIRETHWGYSAASGRYYISDFRPVDALWWLFTEGTDWYKYHDVVLWYDQNTIDDFIIDESDLATITEDVMARTLSIAYCDRYGSLHCVPDPDVRADEWWGTPSPQYTGAQALTPDLVTDYTIQYHDYRVQKLTLEAYGRDKRGIYAYSLNPTAFGDRAELKGLLCDEGATLASWAVQKRAQMNRQWQIAVSTPLNRSMDLVNFADVNFTAPNQSNGKTASGRTWLQSLTYRPNIMDGSWVGRWTLMQQTEGVGEAETGAISAWGGTGLYAGLLDNYAGAWDEGDPDEGGPDGWCLLFDFKNAGELGFSAYAPSGQTHQGTGGVYVAAAGWFSEALDPDPPSTNSAQICGIRTFFAPRILTGIEVWGSATGNGGGGLKALNLGIFYSAEIFGANDNAFGNNPTGYASLTGETTTASGVYFNIFLDQTGDRADQSSGVIESAKIGGQGTNPFPPGVGSACP